MTASIITTNPLESITNISNSTTFTFNFTISIIVVVIIIVTTISLLLSSSISPYHHHYHYHHHQYYSTVLFHDIKTPQGCLHVKRNCIPVWIPSTKPAAIAHFQQLQKDGGNLWINNETLSDLQLLGVFILSSLFKLLLVFDNFQFCFITPVRVTFFLICIITFFQHQIATLVVAVCLVIVVIFQRM